MTFHQRLKYTKNRNWIFRFSFFGILLPKVATDWDIEIDYAYRDAIQKTRKNK